MGEVGAAFTQGGREALAHYRVRWKTWVHARLKDDRWDVHFEDSFFDDVSLRLNNRPKYR